MHNLGNLAVDGYSTGFAINDSGLVVGFSTDGGSFPNDGMRAFLYDSTMHDLGTLGGTRSGAQAINNGGQVTGWAERSDFSEHVFLYDGTMHDLGTLGGLCAPVKASTTADR